MKIKNRDDLNRVKEAGCHSLYPGGMKLSVGTATCGLAAGADKVLAKLLAMRKALNLDYVVEETGCIGFCQKEPLMVLYRPGLPKVVFQAVDPEKAESICRGLSLDWSDDPSVLGKISQENILLTGETHKFVHNGSASGNGMAELDALPFYRKQLKVALRNCGYIDAYNLEHYIARGGYQAVYRVLTEWEPEAVIEEVRKSGLRGRGGGGFLTGRKWRYCRDAPGKKHYIICNADEGDPGAFMDRSLLEGDPHSVIEGMMIGAWAIGGDEGYIYVRNEYPQAIRKLSQALESARNMGILGDNVMGTGFSFNIHLNRGGGAFVCGESTALMASIEGKVGEPRAKYIHTVEQGLHDQPTCLNNVETWANVPAIMQKGADWFAGIGTEHSKGTKVFSLVGDVTNSGLIEVPMGISIREVLYDIGGGLEAGHRFKAVQTGGPSGGTILVDEKGATLRATDAPDADASVSFMPESLLDLPVDFDSLTEAGSMMGSGGLIVMDESTCMVDIARYYLNFLCEESCGRCLPCREGLRQMVGILNRITGGEGRHGDIELLEELGRVVMDTSLCALGGTAANPPLSTLRYFREEYEAHIYDKKCPAGICKSLIRFEVDQEKCRSCNACFKACSADAVTVTEESVEAQPDLDGQEGSEARKKPRKHYHIKQDLCVKCGICQDVCKFDAVRKE